MKLRDWLSKFTLPGEKEDMAKKTETKPKPPPDKNVLMKMRMEDNERARLEREKKKKKKTDQAGGYTRKGRADYNAALEEVSKY